MTYFSPYNGVDKKEEQLYGVSKPICKRPPGQVDKKMASHLKSVISEAKLEEHYNEASRRELVLAELNEMCQLWAKQATLDKNMSHTMAEESCVRLYTFGSFRLGVH